MEPNDAASTSVRAQELRASLGARREVEALLAEASATREAAVADADAIIEEAQQVSEQLVRESRAEAERITTDSRSRAEGLVASGRDEAEEITRQARAAADAVRARAEAHVEEHRRRVRAELTEQVTRELNEQRRRELARLHEHQEGMIGDIEASVRILGVSMESAVANIGEMLAALDSLRSHTADSLHDATAAVNGASRHTVDAVVDTGDPADDFVRGARDSHGGDRDDAGDDDEESDPAPGRARSGHLIDILADLDGAAEARDARDDLAELDAELDAGLNAELEAELDDDSVDGDDDRPLTATEAFLRSSHIDHGDPPLPPSDDSDVSARYARDAMRATARARTRRDEETLEIAPARDAGQRPRRNGKPGPDEREPADDDESAGKPLGWLFRSSS